MYSKLIFIFMCFVPAFVAAQVSEEWVQRYNAQGNDSDRANSIAVDDFGNIYVTGASFLSGQQTDYTTIKYNSAGVQQWLQRYNGPSNGYDYATAIFVDPSLNVYVTGYSTGSGTGYDYATIKYNSSGVQQWVSRYNGPGNSGDAAYSIAVDVSGNVCVTGKSNGGATSDFDYATIKYDAFGVQQWVRRYTTTSLGQDQAYSIAVDILGNVYVTGGRTSGNITTIKYNSSGDSLWVQRYSRPGNIGGIGYSIVVDASLNVYVTGYTSSSSSSFDYTTLKYNSSGVEQWVQIYNINGGPEIANDIAVDDSGNVYVTGQCFEGPTTSNDYATIKYNSSGIQQWIQRYNGTNSGSDYAYALAIDTSGNVYVTGSSYGGGSQSDYATVKYNPFGIQQWVQRYNGPANSSDYASSIAIDASGNVYVTGRSQGNGDDYATIKYSQSVGIQQISTEIPENFLLEQNYPNPFNPTTNIKFDITEKSFVKLVIYNSLGKEVSTLVNEELNAGSYKMNLDASEFSSGVYFYKLETENFAETKRMVFLK